MDTESIRLFVLAAEKLNISAAGRQLGMAPAVASARLAKLEHQLGADLLHRSTRKVVLSAEGEDFLPYAREILAQEQTARAVLGLEWPDVSGRLRFTAPASFAQLYIAPILPDFMALYPYVTLELRLSDSRLDLIDGSFDLALRNAEIEDSSLKGRKLADDARYLCASPDYIARHGMPLHPQDLPQHRLIGFHDMRPRDLYAGNALAGQFAPRQAAQHLMLDDGTAQKQATLAGAGISLNSAWLVHEELRDGSLVRVLPDYRLDDQSVLWLLYPKTNVLTAKTRVLMDFLLDRLGKRPVWLIP